MPLEAHHCKTLSASTRQVQSFCHKNFYRSIKLVHFSTKQRRNNPKSTKQKDKNKKKKTTRRIKKPRETSRNQKKSMSKIGTRMNSIGRTFSKFSCYCLKQNVNKKLFTSVWGVIFGGSGKGTGSRNRLLAQFPFPHLTALT